MSLTIIIGAQWGDEGKGRITDLLASKMDIVARFSGGDNAGHTITLGDQIYKLHLIPSGIIHENTTCLIGGGVVLNPRVFLREVRGLRERGISVTPERLQLSRTTHLITPAHIALDKAKEAARGDKALGTTQRGIGPAYADKTSRIGLRAGLLAKPEELADAMYAHIEAKNVILREVYDAEPLDAPAIAVEYLDYAKQIAPYLTDGVGMLHSALAEGKRVLAEGAQGTLLDLDHGTYPYVTSSWPTSSGALVGLGLGPKSADTIIGVTKAFSSRVGAGAFVTELDGEMAHRLRGSGANPWDEYGTTTGRPRRVGWLDIPALRYATEINSFTELVLTKLDILSGLEEIPVCVAYEMDGSRVRFSADNDTLNACKPVCETLPGWSEDITNCTSFAELPANAQAYVNYVAEQIGIPVSTVSVGPARRHTIFL